MSISSAITVDSSSGLGIDLFPEEFNKSGTKTIPKSTPSNGTSASHDHAQPIQHGQRNNASLCSDSNGSSTSTTPLPSILDLDVESPGEPSARMPLTAEVRSKSRPNYYPNDYMGIFSKQHHSSGRAPLSRARVLLPIDGTPMQNAEDLKQILGNANSRLKSGAILTLGPFFDQNVSRTGKSKTISLEQARSRSRVNLDIFLESNVCVQGGNMQGYIQIRVRKYLKKNYPILISGGKLRLIGFESTGNDQELSIFYQCSAPLAEITHGLERLYSSEPDDEGFAASPEGIHLFPFVLHLTPDSEKGISKGTFNVQNGPTIRYVAMVSLVIKDSASGKQSIAHFYRDCSIWPRFNPSTVLAPTSRPIQVTASESLRIGGNGVVKLTASLHRLHWVSGQSCFVGVKIVNNSERAVKSVSLRLIRSTTVFKVGYKFDNAGSDQRNIAIADELQSSTTTKEVAQSNLEVCGRGTRGHASAKGWWAGVIPCQTRSFSHHILIPLGAVSISRGNLIEVSYTLQVSVNMGSILATDVQVSLPIEIINFLSIDPPPGFIRDFIGVNHSSDSILEFPSYSETDGTEGDSGEDEGYSSEGESLDNLRGIGTYDDRDEPTAPNSVAFRPATDQDEDHARFADLYYSSLGEKLDKQAEQFWEKQQHDSSNARGLHASESHSGNPKNTFAFRVKEKYLQQHAAATVNDPSKSGQSDRYWTGVSESGDQPKYGPTEQEILLLSESSSSLEPSSRLLASNTEKTIAHTQDNDSSSTKDNQKPRSYAADPKTSSSPRIPRDSFVTSDSQLATRSPISGVGLPVEGYNQRPTWKAPATSRPGDISQSTIRKLLPRVPNDPCDDSLEKPSPTLQQSQSMVTSKSSTQTGDNPNLISSLTVPRTGSVKDKIRELEELATKTADGT